MQVNVVKSAMMYLVDQAKEGYLGTIGVSKSDFAVLSQAKPWKGVDRYMISRVFESLLSGTLSVMGVQPFELPAEYIAAGISLFVHPINHSVACRYFERRPSSESLVRGNPDIERIDAGQLFAMVLEVSCSSDCSVAVSAFEKKTKIAMERYPIEEEVTVSEGSE